MRKLLCAALLAGAGLARAAAPEVTLLKAGELPAGIQTTGKLVQAVSWHDKTGDNLAILTQTGEQWDKDEQGRQADTRSARLKAVQLRKDGERWKTVWAVNDAIEACQVDVVCAFVKNTLEVTDINDDGVAEVSFVYRLGCFGGMDPWGQKLLLVEDGRKYALRGETTMREAGGVYGGGMKPDPAFKHAPAGFEAFARKKWQRYADHDLRVY